MADLDGFTSPDWDAPLDVVAYQTLAPQHATVKGMFFRSAQKIAQARGAELKEAYVAFKDYPLSEYMRNLVRCAELAFPEATLREGLRRLGWDAYPTWASSVIGKIVNAVGGGDFERTLQTVSKAYSVVGSVGRAELDVVESGRAIIALRQIQSFADAYHVGVFEGALRHFGRTGSIRVRLHDLADQDLLIEWAVAGKSP